MAEKVTGKWIGPSVGAGACFFAFLFSWGYSHQKIQESAYKDPPSSDPSSSSLNALASVSDTLVTTFAAENYLSVIPFQPPAPEVPVVSSEGAKFSQALDTYRKDVEPNLRHVSDCLDEEKPACPPEDLGHQLNKITNIMMNTADVERLTDETLEQCDISVAINGRKICIIDMPVVGGETNLDSKDFGTVAQSIYGMELLALERAWYEKADEELRNFDPSSSFVQTEYACQSICKAFNGSRLYSLLYRQNLMYEVGEAYVAPEYDALDLPALRQRYYDTCVALVDWETWHKRSCQVVYSFEL